MASKKKVVVKKKLPLICEDYDTKKKYAKHKWRYDPCDCPHCCGEHQSCERCYEPKDE